MFVIGLTGSIAMGKTTTARLFAEDGVPVHDADAAVHKLYAGEAAGLIEAAFPGSTKNGMVDRVRLGLQVTNDPPALRRLEEIVHPLVRNAERKFLREAELAGAKVVVLDVPLLFETGGESRVDATVVVSAPADMQRQRVLERGVSLERLEALLARQIPDEEKRRRADFVVDSAQGLEHARDRVRQILAAVAKMPPRRK
jgi:dephospho-CoA kinase